MSETAKKEHLPQKRKRQVTGVVVSDKMDKTVVVKVGRQIKHPYYGKYINRSANYKAHDEKNEVRTGDFVSLVETRPMSKSKRWAIKEVIRKGKRLGVLSTDQKDA